MDYYNSYQGVELPADCLQIWIDLLSQNLRTWYKEFELAVLSPKACGGARLKSPMAHRILLKLTYSFCKNSTWVPDQRLLINTHTRFHVDSFVRPSFKVISQNWVANQLPQINIHIPVESQHSQKILSFSIYECVFVLIRSNSLLPVIQFVL